MLCEIEKWWSALSKRRYDWLLSGQLKKILLRIKKMAT